MIEFKNVSKSYRKGIKAVDDLSLTINDGEIFGFLGPNGAGKSTTIRMLTGILNIDEGQILLDGKDIEKEPIEAKKMFGYVADDPDQFLALKGIEYLNFMADVYNVENRKEKIQQLTEKFEIADALSSRIESYSHGMRQKIVICGCLMHDPKNWILDEPMTGLDPRSSFDLKEMMRKHAAAGNCVFFSTHVLDVAEKLCDRVVWLQQGKVVEIGDAKTVCNNYLRSLGIEVPEEE